MKITGNLHALIPCLSQADDSVHPQGTWGLWLEWSPCPALCGQVGVHARSRTCQSRSTPCTGPRVEGKHCSEPECPKPGQTGIIYSAPKMKKFSSLRYWACFRSPDCSLLCVMGTVNAECDACTCEEHTLLGSVRGAGGLTAEGTAILRSGKLLTVTDHNGHFRIPGICPDGNTTLTFILKGHSALGATVPHSGERVSVLSVQLKRTGTRTDWVYTYRRTTNQNNSAILFLFFREAACAEQP